MNGSKNFISGKLNPCGFLFFLVLVSAVVNPVYAADSIDNSVQSELAHKSLILDVTHAGSNLVAVGERGHVLLKSPEQDWQQVLTPTRRLLTSVFFSDEQHGWITGHDAIILKTDDAGRHWQKIYEDIENEAPLLDIHVFEDGRGIAIGAYGLYLISEDSGVSWKESAFNIIHENKEEDDFFDYHLHQIVVHPGGHLFLITEAGYMFRSDDKGISWKEINSPYNGSLFTLLVVDEGVLLAGGLRGNLFRSENLGQDWTKINTNTSELITFLYLDQNDRLFILGHGATLLKSNDHGLSSSAINIRERNNFTGVIEDTNGALYLFGDMGIRQFPGQNSE